MYWAIFKTNEDTINDKILGCHYSYIIEKFNTFFFNTPDKNDIFMDLHWGNQDVWNKGTEYMIHWKLDLNTFINSKEYPMWLFTHYLIHSSEELDKIVETRKYRREEIITRSLLAIYNKFFKSYDSISDDKNLDKLLHPILKKEYIKYVQKQKFFFRNVYLNQLIKNY